MVHSHIRPHTHIVLRLPSGLLKVVEIAPNLTISIGKFGSFPANQLLGRPYNLTYEILDREDGKDKIELRVVPASELHEEVIKSEELEAQPEGATPTALTNEGENGGVEFDIVAEDGSVLMRSNRLTVDDPTRQALSMEEIEELKKAGTSSGMDIIKKIMAAHKALDEKTSFSLAKYTLRKSKKYLKRFEVLPMDVGMLTEVMLEKEAHRIMEAREEMLGLIGAWSNVHYGGASTPVELGDGAMIGGGRWLVVDETGGLIVASLAEKMGILYPPEEEDGEFSEEDEAQGDEDMPDAPAEEDAAQDQPETLDANAETAESKPEPPNGDAKSTKPKTSKAHHNNILAQSATTNSITLLHSAAQPNLGLLKYFNYDASSPAQSPTHPLHKHLKTISWLQLLDPTADVSYEEPETVAPDVLATWKSGKRGTYYRKRRRWERIRRVIAETRGGGFDGLIVASWMNPTSVLRHTVPLLRGGAQVVAYSPTIEPLSEVMDYYSRERKAAFIQRTINADRPYNPDTATDEEKREFDEDFPVNPTLLLAPMLQTSRVRAWQVLPGRTHPLMTSKGGAEGFVFTGTRVVPAEGPIAARGNFGKKRKTAEKTDGQTEGEKEAKKTKVNGEHPEGEGATPVAEA
ncbi:Gcd10p family-domain-containing protein [Phyllosticta citribraziliensis]|uniref:tRNA (adenine(58)-N(1))-methyltransferase non-catalytic subunit TRM6 n=1 Tax=Phyllosticta citribraziliensis TaxID=989973 RepID=A0ABR1LID9_9PEZI